MNKGWLITKVGQVGRDLNGNAFIKNYEAKPVYAKGFNLEPVIIINHD